MEEYGVQILKEVANELLNKIESNNSATTLGTLYATDLLRNTVEHPFSCMVNNKSTQQLNIVNRNMKLQGDIIEAPTELAQKKYLKYKAKYLALKQKLRNRQ